MSTQTMNGKIINNYPIFEGSQVLTSTQLNGLFNYLDQQTRYTRSRLIGMGIVCGLHLKAEGNQAHLSEGIGITSDGFLVKMPDCTMNYHRDYFLPSGVIYEPFGEFDEDNIFSQYDDVKLFELLANKPEEGECQPIGETFLDDKYLLIFLECYDRDPRSCLGKNCEDLGKERIFTTRKLAVDKAGLDKILTADPGEGTDVDRGVENPFAVTSGLVHVDLQKPLFDPDDGDEPITFGSLLEAYRNILYQGGNDEKPFQKLFGAPGEHGLLFQTYEEFSSFLYPVYNSRNPFLEGNNTRFSTVKTELSDFLGSSNEEELLGVQEVYSYFDLLIRAYHEFATHAEQLTFECCPKKSFSLHLMLGKISFDDSKELDEWGNTERSQYRHQFLQPQIHHSQNLLLKKVISLHKRLVLIVESLHLPQVKNHQAELKITPFYGQSSLGDRAIPMYLSPDKAGSVPGVKTTSLGKEWNFDLSVTSRKENRILSYAENEISADNLTPAELNYVKAPLLYPSDFEVFKVEGIIGKKVQEVSSGEKSIRDKFHLPFSILPLQVELDTAGISVESHYWQDLQTEYKSSKGELVATIRNLVGDLKAFYKEASAWSTEVLPVDVELTNFHEQLNYALEKIHTPLDQPGELCTLAEGLISTLPVTIEELYLQANTNFADLLSKYKLYRRELSKALLRVIYAYNILEREKIEVMPADVFARWSRGLHFVENATNTFLRNNDFYQLHIVYHRFANRYLFLQQNHYSVLTNFLRLHPGVDHSPVSKGGTHILVYRKDAAADLPADCIFADFTLPYHLDPSNIHIPLDPGLNQQLLPPLGRGEVFFLMKGETRSIDVIVDDLDPNGEPIEIAHDSYGYTNDQGVFVPRATYEGNTLVNEASMNRILRFEPTSGFTGTDYFEYTVENPADAELEKDHVYVEVLVTTPYRKHIRAISDLAATDNHHSIEIDVLTNDTFYPDTVLSVPAQSDLLLAPLKIAGNKICYTPVYGREGKDTFTYQIDYTENGVTEHSKAEVEVIVFCCDRVEFELICEGNTGAFDVLIEREKADDNVQLKLLDAHDKLVDIIETTHSQIEVRPSASGDYPALFYTPDRYFKGEDVFVYEVKEGTGHVRRSKLHISVIACSETRFERTLKDTTGKFYVLSEGQGDLKVFSDRNELLDELVTANGTVKVTNDRSGDFYLEYTPSPGYYGLDQLQYAFTDEEGHIHYYTLQVLIDGYEKVRVESTFQDTAAVFEVLSEEMLANGFTIRLISADNELTDEIASEQGGTATIDSGSIWFEPKTGFLGDDAFRYAVLRDDQVIEYGKFYVIMDTNRKVSVEYTLRDLTKDIYVLSADQISQGAVLSITSQPSVSGSTVEIFQDDEEVSYVKYTPAEGYIGQDSFGYLVEVGEVKLYGTVYMVVDSNERLEILTLFKNKSLEFALFEPSVVVSEFEVTQPVTNGAATWVSGTNIITYVPNEDYIGQDKLKYKARIGESIQYGTIYFLVTCECKDITVTGTVTDETGVPLANARVEETGTGTNVLTGASGVYSILASPTAKLAFSKVGHEPKEVEIAYRTTLNVKLNRKVVVMSGVVKDAQNQQPVIGALIEGGLDSTTTNAEGEYELQAYTGTTIRFSATGYFSKTITAPNQDGVVDVVLEPSTVQLSGTVRNIQEKPIPNAVVSTGSTTVRTNADGFFDIPAIVGNSISFAASGYFTQEREVPSESQTLNITLQAQTIIITATAREKTFDKVLLGNKVIDDLTGEEFVTGESTIIAASFLSNLTFRSPGFISEVVAVNSLTINDGKATLVVGLVPAEVTVRGVVRGTDEQLIPDAVITVNGDEVTKTGTEGEYEVKVIVWDLLSAKADGYDPAASVSILPVNSETSVDVSETIINDENEATIDFNLSLFEENQED